MNVIDATYLDIRSAHRCVWPVEREWETGMAVSSTIFNVGRSRTSESQFAHMQILARSCKHKNAWWWLEWLILSVWVNRRACSKVLSQLEGEKEGETDRRKEKHRTQGIEALELICPSLGKLSCKIHCSILTQGNNAILSSVWKLILLIYCLHVPSTQSL